MSFTTNIKNEMLNIEYPETEIIAELSAIINISAEIKKLLNTNNTQFLNLTSEIV